MPKATGPPMKTKQFILFFSVLTAALGLRLSIASQGLTYLDRMFLPDDTYYTLSIARNLAAGIGPSANGEVLTSGFQPLTAFLMVPVFLLGTGADTAVYIAILLSALFGAISCALFTLVIQHSTHSSSVALVAGLLAATCPLILRNDLNGLETSTAMMLSLMSILLFVRLPENPSFREMATLGVVIGLMILARVDTVVIAAAIGVSMLAKSNVRHFVRAPLVALMVVAPWWTYCTLHFGSPIPESGAAVRQLIVTAGDARLPPMVELRLAVTKLLESAQIKALPTLTGLVILTVLALMTLAAAFRKKDGRGVMIVILCGAIFTAFYVIYLPAFWFFHRYLHFAFFSVITCIVALPAFIFRNTPALRNSVPLGLGIFIIAMNVIGTLPFYSKPQATMYAGVDGAKGYREIAQEILSELPDGAKVGSPQSGALGYYANRGIEVTNLDGVVDKNTFLAIKTRTLADSIRSRNIEYIAGWNINISDIRNHSTHASNTPSLIEINRFKKQQGDQFALYMIKY